MDQKRKEAREEGNILSDPFKAHQHRHIYARALMRPRQVRVKPLDIPSFRELLGESLFITRRNTFKSCTGCRVTNASARLTADFFRFPVPPPTKFTFPLRVIRLSGNFYRLKTLPNIIRIEVTRSVRKCVAFLSVSPSSLLRSVKI